MAGKMIGVEIGNDTVKLVVTNGNAVQSMAVQHMPENLVLDGKVASPDAMANVIKEMRKEFRSPGGSAAGEFVRGIQSHTDDRDLCVFKYGQDTCANAHGVFHGMLPILPCPPQVIKRRAAENDGRVNAHAVR